MDRLRTLRFRFALWTAGLFLIGLSAFGAFVFASMARGLKAALDESLSLVGAQVAAGLDIEGGRPVFSEDFATEPENDSLRARGFTVRILDPVGIPLEAFGPGLGRLPAPASGLVPSFSTLSDSTAGEPLRLRTVPVESAGRLAASVQVAQSLADVQETLRRLRSALLISVPLLVLLTGLGGYFLAGRALAPIDRITRTARGIAEGSQDLSTRLDPPRTDDEVGRLAETLNAMLSRLDDSFRRERQFTIDASHELRTPLAAMQAILGQIGQRRRSVDEYERALTDLSDETDRLHALTDDLLALAREEGGRAGPAAPVDLSLLLRDVADSLRPLAVEKGLSVAYAVPAGLTVPGFRDDLIRLFVNLLDNAIKFTDQGEIRLAGVDSGDGWVLATLTDTGRGIPPEQLPHVFDRFYRGDHARSTTGTGLGLALASAIARSHGGRIDVASRTGEGTTFTVVLPASRAPVAAEKSPSPKNHSPRAALP